SRLEAASIRAQRAEALRSVQTAEPRLVVRGQYQGYLEEPRVAPDSPRETFVAVRLATHAPRWLGVPFYLRSGKRLAARSGFIFLAFHPSPEGQRGGLLLRLSPEVGLDLTLLGRGKPETLSFRLGPEPEFDAYEEVLLAALSGDLTPFPSQEEVEEAWRVLDPVLKAWEEGEPEVYPQGSEGPGGQMGILKPGHAWVSLRG
ncbi:glucose-6-phosphate dehydrogenase, partial [Thermus scotoductus]